MVRQQWIASLRIRAYIDTSSTLMQTKMTLRHKANALLNRATQAGDVPGVVAMATNGEGTIDEGAFCQPVLGQGPAMSLNTRCWIASMTEALTAAGAMQRVKQGELDIDSPVRKIGPQMAETRALTGFDANFPSAGVDLARRHALATVTTIRELATKCSQQPASKI